MLHVRVQVVVPAHLTLSVFSKSRTRIGLSPLGSIPQSFGKISLADKLLRGGIGKAKAAGIV